MLEVKKGNDEAARHFFRQAQKLSADTFEAFYNGALLAFRLGDFQARGNTQVLLPFFMVKYVTYAVHGAI